MCLERRSKPDVFGFIKGFRAKGLDFAELSSVFITCLGSFITVFHQRPLLEKHASMPQFGFGS